MNRFWSKFLKNKTDLNVSCQSYLDDLDTEVLVVWVATFVEAHRPRPGPVYLAVIYVPVCQRQPQLLKMKNIIS